MERSSSPRPLPTYAAEVLEVLEPKIAATVNGLPRDEVKTHLDREGFEASTVEVALEELLNRGYIYEVNDHVRLTDTST